MRLPDRLNISLLEVDEALLHIIRTDPDLTKQSIIYRSIHELIQAGGKRLRPMITIVGSRFGKEPSSDLVLQLAAVLEYIHMASLIHDDIIDRAEMRRNEPALHIKTNIPTAVHVANYMMARVMEWAASLMKDSSRWTNTLSTLVTRLCLGEYQQLHTRFDFDLTLEQYLTKTNNKTALLIATCLQAGSLAAGAESDVGELLYTFGEYVGMAFQIRDDVLDFTCTSGEAGKPVGADLLNGQVTLPVLYALDIPELAGPIRSLHSLSTAEEIKQVVHMIAQSEAIDRSLQLAAQYTSRAELLLEQLSAYPARRDLQALLDYFTCS